MRRITNCITDRLAGFSRDQRGTAATEWAVLVSCIAVVAMVGISSVGQNAARLFGNAAAILRAYL